MSTRIETVEELDALPVGSVVLDYEREAWQKVAEALWVCTSGDSSRLHWSAPNEQVFMLLYRPDDPAPSAEDREALGDYLADLADVGPDTPVDLTRPEYALAMLVATGHPDWQYLGERVFAALVAAAPTVDPLTPPPGWFVFGTHANDGSDAPLDFYGDDGGGMPVWERPAAPWGTR